ncbi:MAG TPA: WGxxGxxG family protein [Natronosporangium sp.]|nr:WGxxGxxG family protein [Natronosporangium sp.]
MRLKPRKFAAAVVLGTILPLGAVTGAQAETPPESVVAQQEDSGNGSSGNWGLLGLLGLVGLAGLLPRRERERQEGLSRREGGI